MLKDRKVNSVRIKRNSVNRINIIIDEILRTNN